MSRSNLSSRDADAHSPVHATDTVHGIDTVRRPEEPDVVPGAAVTDSCEPTPSTGPW